MGNGQEVRRLVEDDDVAPDLAAEMIAATICDVCDLEVDRKDMGPAGICRACWQEHDVMPNEEA